MTQFTASSLISDASELDDLLFKKGQNLLNEELNSFVEQFETGQELVDLDSLAKTYVNLTGCGSMLNSAKSTIHLDPVMTQINTTQETLNQLLKSVQETQNKTKSVPFEQERQAFLLEKQIKLKNMETEIRKESDKLDEYYTKKTRESIYRNLVGSNQWLQS